MNNFETISAGWNKPERETARHSLDQEGRHATAVMMEQGQKATTRLAERIDGLSFPRLRRSGGAVGGLRSRPPHHRADHTDGTCKKGPAIYQSRPVRIGWGASIARPIRLSRPRHRCLVEPVAKHRLVAILIQHVSPMPEIGDPPQHTNLTTTPDAHSGIGIEIRTAPSTSRSL